MGLRLFSSCSNEADRKQGRCEHDKKPKVLIVGNPNPANFKILQSEKVGRFVIIMVRYPECLNYEGKKILVFKDVRLKEIEGLGFLDPHFCNSGHHPSPIARFVPTSQGFKYAMLFCQQASGLGRR